MVARTLTEKLPLNFSGGLIVYSHYYRSDVPYVLMVFKGGYLEDYLPFLASHYAEEELPTPITDWLAKNDFSDLTIYSDSHSFVSMQDFDRILGADACRTLEPQMDCVQ